MTAIVMFALGLAMGWFGHKYFGPQIVADIDAKIKSAEEKVEAKL